MKGRPLILTVCVAIGFFGVACYPHFDYQEQIGPDARTGLLIFFKTDTTPEDINAFEDRALHVLRTGGYDFVDGVCGLGNSVVVQEHDSIFVDYCPMATATQKDKIKATINASPLVFKVLENVIPAKVNKIE